LNAHASAAQKGRYQQFAQLLNRRAVAGAYRAHFDELAFKQLDRLFAEGAELHQSVVFGSPERPDWIWIKHRHELRLPRRILMLIHRASLSFSCAGSREA
jgi:hypothetical protein